MNADLDLRLTIGDFAVRGMRAIADRIRTWPFRRTWRDRHLRGRPEELWLALIAQHAPARTFVDVGCMWRVNGEYAFAALRSGASAVTGIDINGPTPAFLERNAAVGNAVRFVQGDLNDPALSAWIGGGGFDVVFCSGVLYHVPNPIFSLTQLRRICRERLILTTASTAEISTRQAAVLLPGLSDDERRRLAYRSGPGRKVGLDSPFEPDKGYGNWFWLPTPSCVQTMVDLAGFRVDEIHKHRHVTTIVATPR